MGDSWTLADALTHDEQARLLRYVIGYEKWQMHDTGYGLAHALDLWSAMLSQGMARPAEGESGFEHVGSFRIVDAYVWSRALSEDWQGVMALCHNVVTVVVTGTTPDQWTEHDEVLR